MIHFEDIKLETGNNCPGAAEVFKYLSQANLDMYAEIKGIEDSSSWQNDHATLVLCINRDAAPSRVYLELGQLATLMNADEFHYRAQGPDTFVRIWWD